MSMRLSSLVLLIASTTFAVSAANAASFSPNLAIRTAGPQTTGMTGPQTTPMTVRHYGYGSGYGPPPPAGNGGQHHWPSTSGPSNDQFDTSGNLNSGGGGGGVKPSKSPSLK